MKKKTNHKTSPSFILVIIASAVVIVSPVILYYGGKLYADLYCHDASCGLSEIIARSYFIFPVLLILVVGLLVAAAYISVRAKKKH